MKNKIEFNNIVDRAMKVAERSQMRPVIEKELLHYDILFALDKDNLLDKLTFQGGTALRLCYGALRFSEDLDFVGGENFKASDLITMKDCLEGYLGDRYGLAVFVKEPKELENDSRGMGIQVNRWQISITTAPLQKDLPKQRIRIEVVSIPAYSREPLALQRNYDFLPDGYSDVLILTESMDEIMADKLIAFVNCTRHIRYRDIWDLRWLKQHSAKINPDYILSKIADYHATDYLPNLEKLSKRLPEIIKGKAFFDEMSRFIPMNVLETTLMKDKFLDFLTNEIQNMLDDVKKIIK